MTAFAISAAEILDEDLADRYRLLAQESIVRYHGRYVIRGTPEAIEGEWPPQRRLIIVEFPDMSTLREWYSSASRCLRPESGAPSPAPLPPVPAGWRRNPAGRRSHAIGPGPGGHTRGLRPGCYLVMENLVIARPLPPDQISKPAWAHHSSDDARTAPSRSATAMNGASRSVAAATGVARRKER